MTLRQSLDKLAIAIADTAALEETPLSERIEALKVLTPYYAVLLKSSRTADESDDTTFESFVAHIEGAEKEPQNGRTEELPGRRRKS